MYIGIGQYQIFWKDFFDSAEQYFLTHHIKEYFVFTDSKDIYQKSSSRVHQIHQENLGWTFNTLKHFEMFLSIQDKLTAFDFIFFMNANVLFCKEIDEGFLPIQEDFTLVEHFCLYNKLPYAFPYDRNPHSTAYIPFYKGKYYVRGGVNGGKTQNFLHLIQTLHQATQTNLQRNIIALWHDESHLNHYMINQKNIKVFHPGYCYAQGCDEPFEVFILLREKSKYLALDSIKQTDPNQTQSTIPTHQNTTALALLKKKIKTLIKYCLAFSLFAKTRKEILKKYKNIQY